MAHAVDHPAASEDTHAVHPVDHAKSHESGQQHPLGVYFKIWGLLFVLSIFSYLVDYYEFQGILRWSLILIFMVLKAGLIIAVFMHMMWERLALVYAVVVPPLLLLVLLGIGALEAEYTFVTRGTFFSPATETPAPVKQP